MIDVVDVATAIAQIDERLDDREDILLAQYAHGVRGVEIETHVHFHATDRRKVVALAVEEQRVEHRLGAVERRRFAGAHDAVDVEQCILARGILVHLQRVADIGADVDVVDLENRNLLEVLLHEQCEQLFGDLVSSLGEDFTGLGVIQVFGDILADHVRVARAHRLQALLDELTRRANRQFPAGLHHHLAGVGVDEVGGYLDALHAIGIVGHSPALLLARVDRLPVESRQNLLAIEAEREEQRSHGNFAAAVDARVYDVLRVELDVEPRPAIGNDARGEQQLARRMALAFVVVEEHAGAAVHLRNDDALGAVDDEGAVVGHERHVAHVHVLLLDILDGPGLRLRVDVEHDQAQRHLQRRSVSHSALAALVDIVFRRLILVFHKLELGGLREIRNREHRLENRLQALVGAAALRRPHDEKLVVGSLLHFDQVRHLADFLDVAEDLANTFAAGECLRHVAPQILASRAARSTLAKFAAPLRGRRAMRAFGPLFAPAVHWTVGLSDGPEPDRPQTLKKNART